MSGKRHIYLNMKTRAEARNIFLSQFSRKPVLGQEEVATPDAVGRILAQPVYAVVSSPGYHAAAMDGIAVLAEDTFGASEKNPLSLVVGEKAHFVNTGHRLPPGTDAVIMIENVHSKKENIVQIEAAAYPWQYVRKVGEDMVATEMLFPRNHKVSPTCMAAILTGGVFSVHVKKPPRALVIPTGDELVDWRKIYPEEIPPGRVIETNSWMLGKLIEKTGGQWVRNETLVDDFFVIRQAVERGVKEDYDMVLILAGSSAGSEDHTANIIGNLGEALVHGVTIMPGKPVVLGVVNEKPVIGIPGYPVSAIVAFEEFVRPLLCQMLGQTEEKRPVITVESPKKIPSKLGIEDLVRVKLGRVGDHIIATPLPRGAGSITSFTEAHGIIRIPNESEGLRPKEPLSAELLVEPHMIDNTIVVVGSHDNTLDVLADMQKAADPNLCLSSSHVGSMGGLMAIKRGACHMAGSHLLDTETGSYNLSYIEKHLADIPVRVVNLVMRDQGLIVAKGNPKNIKGIEDLVRKDITFINRQAGSGTRILLDYRIGQQNIMAKDIQGYNNEEYTHMAVAVAVMSQAADVGLGICAAAKALDLEFIPIVTEQYDLIIPQIHFETEAVCSLLSLVRTQQFKKRVEALGGYHLEKTGEVLL